MVGDGQPSPSTMDLPLMKQVNLTKLTHKLSYQKPIDFYIITSLQSHDNLTAKS